MVFALALMLLACFELNCDGTASLTIGAPSSPLSSCCVPILLLPPLPPPVWVVEVVEVVDEVKVVVRRWVACSSGSLAGAVPAGSKFDEDASNGAAGELNLLGSGCLLCELELEVVEEVDEVESKLAKLLLLLVVELMVAIIVVAKGPPLARPLVGGPSEIKIEGSLGKGFAVAVAGRVADEIGCGCGGCFACATVDSLAGCLFDCVTLASVSVAPMTT